jgi:hypothetical protein
MASYADFFAVVFLAVLVFFAGDFLAVVDDEADFLAGAFFAGVDFLAVVDFVAVFFAGVDLAAVFLAEADFVAVFFAVFFAGADFVVVFFAGVDLAAVFFVAGADFFAVDDAVDLVAVFFAGAFLLVAAFFAVPAAFFAVPPAAFAVPPAALAVPVAAVSVSLGSFFAPDTTAFRSAPGLNFGTAVFFARMRSPVRGLRTMRAGRMRFSNDPNPVIATFSPLATSRVMVSSTDSSA